ncbi:MAG: tetratricopeptide repeat protein, partial [Candidatus Eisenbacteria bacterium]
MKAFNRGEFEPAAECFEAAVAELRNPHDPDLLLARCYAAEARAHLGLVCFHAGDDARAEREFGRALEHNPGFPELRYYRARLFERSGRVEEAIADLRAALADRPRYPEALQLLAVCFSQLQDEAGSLMALAAALAEGFPLPPRVRGLDLADWDASDWRALPKSGAGGPTPEATAEALTRYRLGDVEGAIQSLRRAVSRHPRWADLRCRLGSFLLEAEQPQLALLELNEALAIHPRFLGARKLAIRAALEMGDGPRATAQARQAVEDFPIYPDLLYWLALCHAREGRLEEAESALLEAVEVNRQFARAQRLLGMVLYARGRHDEALRCLRRGFTRDRELPGEALRSAAQLLGQDNAGGAEAELRRAIAIQPEYPDLHVALARAHRGSGALEDARDAYRRALQLAPGFDIAVLELAVVELAIGASASAEVRLEALARRRPAWPDVLALLGRVRLLRGDPAAAEGPLRSALALAPRDAATHADLGWTYKALGRDLDADAEFAEALRLAPNDAAPRRQLEWRNAMGEGGKDAA